MGCLSSAGSLAWQNAFLLVLISATAIAMQVLGTAGINTEVMCIHPRTPAGLLGLLTSPLVHTSWPVLLSNLLGLWTLGGLLLWQGHRVFCFTYLWLSVVGGLLVWSVARPGPVCGLAGELFGFFAFLTLAALWRRPVSVKAIGGLAVALFLYGGSMMSELLVPTGTSSWHSSWELKVTGLAAGLVWALAFFRLIMPTEGGWAFFCQSQPLSGRNKRVSDSGAVDMEVQTDPEMPSESDIPPRRPAHLVSPPRRGGFGFLSKKKKEEPPLHCQEHQSPTLPDSPLYSAYSHQAPTQGGAWRGVGCASHSPPPQSALEALGSAVAPSSLPTAGHCDSPAGRRTGSPWSPAGGGAWG